MWAVEITYSARAICQKRATHTNTALDLDTACTPPELRWRLRLRHVFPDDQSIALAATRLTTTPNCSESTFPTQSDGAPDWLLHRQIYSRACSWEAYYLIPENSPGDQKGYKHWWGSLNLM